MSEKTLEWFLISDRISDGLNDRFIDLSFHVVSGTIDNTVKGRTTGHLMIEGFDSPMILNLQGNALSDFAGCVVNFSRKHSGPVSPHDAELLEREQIGPVGIITASNKEEVYINQQKMLASPLSIQWFNFPILIEFVIYLVDYDLEIDLPRWKLSQLEMEEQAKVIAVTREVFDEFCLEFEQEEYEMAEVDLIADIFDDLRPKLAALASPEERFAMIREQISSDIDDYAIWELMDVYLSNDDEFDGDNDIPF